MHIWSNSGASMPSSLKVTPASWTVVPSLTSASSAQAEPAAKNTRIMMRKRIDLNQPAKMIISSDLIAQQDWRTRWKHRISRIGTVFDNLHRQATDEAAAIMLAQLSSAHGLAARGEAAQALS